jgi:hypothetical protein
VGDEGGEAIRARHFGRRHILVSHR